MKKLFVILPLVFLLCITFGCQKSEEAAEEPVVDIAAKKQAATNATKVVYDFFEAAFAFNYQGIRDVCTEDFLLFESGVVMNVEDFINFITGMEGSTWTNKFEDVKTNVEGAVAWVTLRNKAEMTAGDQVMKFDWLESAVVKKIEGVWKLAFYHSTTIEPPPPEEK